MESGGFALNVLDAVLVLLLGYVAVRGWRQGAASQIAALGGLALGLLAGVWAAPRIVGWFVSEPGPGTALLTVGLVLVAALVGQGLGLGIGFRLRRAAVSAGLGKIDRGAGVAAGVAGLLFVVWLLSTVLAQGPIPALARQVRGSEVVRALDTALPPPPDVLGRISAFLDDQGFPQVFVQPGGVGIAAPPVPATADEAVRAAAAAGQPSTVQIRAFGCGGIVGSGSGFVPQAGFVVTNAHVVAGFDRLRVRDSTGEHDAVAIHVDPGLDLAVLAVPGVGAPPIAWASAPMGRGIEGATLGFPGGRSEMVVRPATVWPISTRSAATSTATAGCAARSSHSPRRSSAGTPAGRSSPATGSSAVSSSRAIRAVARPMRSPSTRSARPSRRPSAATRRSGSVHAASSRDRSWRCQETVTCSAGSASAGRAHRPCGDVQEEMRIWHSPRAG
jgi:S1-C subfamily serine protease